MSGGRGRPMTLRCAKCKHFSRARRFLEACPTCGSPRLQRIAGNPDIDRGAPGNRGSRFAAARARRNRLLLEEKRREAEQRGEV